MRQLPGMRSKVPAHVELALDGTGFCSLQLYRPVDTGRSPLWYWRCVAKKPLNHLDKPGGGDAATTAIVEL